MTPLQEAYRFLKSPHTHYSKPELRKIIEGLVREIEKRDRQPDPLCEALNSGDGSYRP